MKKNTMFKTIIILATAAAISISCSKDTQKLSRDGKSAKTFFHLPTISFSTADSPEKFGYISLSAECTPAEITKIKANEDKINSGISEMIKKKKSSDMDSIQDLNTLKKEISIKISLIIEENIKKIVIHEIIIQ